MPSPAGEWLVWQLLDSAFPTGGFAHSSGLEAAIQNGAVASGAQCAAYLKQNLRQAMRTAGPFISASFAGEDLVAMDALLDSMLSNHVANRASRQQGQALLTAAQRVFPDLHLQPWRERLIANQWVDHLPVTFAAITGRLGLRRAQALRMYLFMTMRGVVSAAVRLGSLGPMQAQQLQATLAPDLEALLHESLAWTLDDAAQVAPLLELRQATQDRLYSRLFQS